MLTRDARMWRFNCVVNFKPLKTCDLYYSGATQAVQLIRLLNHLFKGLMLQT